MTRFYDLLNFHQYNEKIIVTTTLYYGFQMNGNHD